jgi:PKD repeat protein
MVNSQTPGIVQIAGAGTSPIEGTGSILKLKFNPISTGYSYLNFAPLSQNFFNEGTPSASFQSGYFNVYNPPQLDVNPDSAVLGIGSTLQMQVYYGHTGTLTWTVNDENLASIDQNGLLTALAQGNVVVTATDEANVSGSNQGTIEIRPISLIPEDTEVFQTNQVNIPMTVSDLTGLGVSSAQFNIYLGDDLECVGIETANTVSENSNAEYQNYGDYVQVSLASAQSWSGSGTFFELQVEATDNDYGNRNISFNSGFFNENILFYTENGICIIKELPSLTITPNSFEIFAGNDIQLTVSDNATAPVVWTSSDEDVATVDQNGLMTALKSGNVMISVEDAVNASGEISNITIYDGKINVNQTYAEPQAQIRVPVSVEDLDIAKAFSSFEMEINYRNPELEFVEIDKNDTECENWSFTENETNSIIQIAAAGVSDVHNGILFYLVFNATEYLTLNEDAYVNIQTAMFNEGFPVLKNYNSFVTGHPVLDVDFSVVDTVVNMQADVQFTDLSSGNPIAWEWDFDNDGTIDATQQNPVWQYADPGFYTVKLTATSLAAKKSLVKEQYIEVLEGIQLSLPSDGLSFDEDESIENHDFLQYIHNIDPLTDSLILSVSGNSHIQVEIDSLNVTFTADENWSGFEELTFQLNDHLDNRMIVSDVMNVIVNPVNDAPILTSNIPDVTIDEDTQTQIEFVEHFDDVDIAYGDELEYAVSSTSTADAYILDDQLMIIPNENWFGDFNMVITATDQGGLSVSDTILVTVNPINDRPVINAPADGFFFLEDESLNVNLAEMIIDVDNDFSELSIEISNNQNVLVDISGTNLNLSATENWYGTENLIFTVSDEISTRNSRDDYEPVVDTIMTVVESVDDLPTIDLPEEIAFRFDYSVDLDLSLYTEDVDGPSVNVSFDPVDSLVIEQNGMIFTISSLNDWIGAVYVTFYVTNLTGAPVNTDSILVRSTNENLPPNLDLPDSWDFNEDENLVLDLIATHYLTDPDSDQFTVEVTGGTNILCEVNTTVLTFSAPENWNGEEMFYVTATDDSLDSATDSILIVVNPVNDEPGLNLPDEFTFNEDETLNVDFSNYINEYDGDPHSVSVISSTIDSIHVDIDGTDVEFSAEPNWFGNGTFVFRVHDDLARDIRMDTVLVTVLPINDAPELTIPTTYEFDEDETVQYDVSGFIADIDNEIADITLSFSGNDHVNLSLTDFVLTVSADADWTGSEVVTFTLSDEATRSRNSRRNTREQVSVDVTFTCLPINDEPQLDLPEGFSFNEDETLVVDFSEYITEVDGDPHSVSLVESGIDSIHVDIDGMFS